MSKGAYYNEVDKYCAMWLKNLMDANLIAAGDIDDRSIEDVSAEDLRGYTQSHFFAGIGVWSYSLRTAGWGDDLPGWTGSCPCQPFSIPGKRLGFNDERDLWPTWFNIIKKRRPPKIFGEQVATARQWIERTKENCEAIDYAFGVVVTRASIYGAQHQRRRILFFADSGCERWVRSRERRPLSKRDEKKVSVINDCDVIMGRAVERDFNNILRSNGSTLAVERLRSKAYGNAMYSKQIGGFIRAAMDYAP